MISVSRMSIAGICGRSWRILWTVWGFASALQQELGVRVEATLPDSYIGGCVLVHDRRRIHMDMTLREKLESSKEHLFEISGLEIEAHDIKKKG